MTHFFVRNIMAITEFSSALNQVATERGIPVENIIESIKEALVTAYKKDRKENGEDIDDSEGIVAKLNSESGEVNIIKDLVDVTPAGFGRIAAQTAKQVILQKIRETEKEQIIKEFKSKIGEIVSGHIFRMEGGLIILDLGKSHAQGIMPPQEQVQTESYRINQRLKVLVKDVRMGPKGTEIIVSRSDADFVIKLFEQEVPEIASGVVTVSAIAREAGSRTKMAVHSKDDKVDPVGSCVGQKGVRVQSIIAELFGEKIDIVPFSNTVEKFIASSLSPAKVTEVEIFEEDKRAVVSVPEDQQSLAIGKEGQNARLANKLTKWKIDIKSAEGLYSDDKSDGASADKSRSSKAANAKVVGIWDKNIKNIKHTKEEKEKKDIEEAAAAAAAKTEEASADDSAAESIEQRPEEVKEPLS